jgi:hypothetical protein
VELGDAGNSIVGQAPCPILVVPRPVD